MNPRKSPETTGSSSLRIAVEEDLAKIAKIEKDVQQYPWTLEKIQEEFQHPDAKVFVLTDDETDERVLGYLFYCRNPEGVRILNIGVPFEVRGVGIGSRMLTQWLGLMVREDVHKVTCEVRKSHDAALQFFQRHRFSIVRIMKNYFRGQQGSLGLEDAYILELPMAAGPQEDGEEI